MFAFSVLGEQKSELKANLRGDDSTGVLRCMTDALDKAVGGLTGKLWVQALSSM